jgi:hypothetical protein
VTTADSLDLIPTEGQSAALEAGLFGLMGAQKAAPFIAKAAQVTKLREMVTRYREAANLPQDEYTAERLTWMASMLEIEADGLERGRQ